MPRISDLSGLPVHQEKNKSPQSTVSRGSNNSNRQSPSLSPQSTLNSSRSSSQNGFVLSNGYSNGLGSVSRLTRSLSTTNLSTSSSSLSTPPTRAPKGFMEKFIASRGKVTPSAFSTTPLEGAGRVVVTRPMRLQPKVSPEHRQMFVPTLLLSKFHNSQWIFWCLSLILFPFFYNSEGIINQAVGLFHEITVPYSQYLMVLCISGRWILNWISAVYWLGLSS